MNVPTPHVYPWRVVALSPLSLSEYVLGASVRSPLRQHPSSGFRSSVQDSPTSPSDHELVAGMAHGDEQAAARIYARHGSIMFGLALRMVGELADAEEVVLDAFAQAWRDAARYETGRGSVLGWLTTIVRTRALDHIRTRGRRLRMAEKAAVMEDLPVAMGQGFAAPDRGVYDGARAAAVSTALGALPDSQRTAIELAFFEGLTHIEVSERLREPLGTIKTRIRLGMQKLRDMLGEHAPENVS